MKEIERMQELNILNLASYIGFNDNRYLLKQKSSLIDVIGSWKNLFGGGNYDIPT